MESGEEKDGGGKEWRSKVKITTGVNMTDEPYNAATFLANPFHVKSRSALAVPNDHSIDHHFLLLRNLVQHFPHRHYSLKFQLLPHSLLLLCLELAVGLVVQPLRLTILPEKFFFLHDLS